MHKYIVLFFSATLILSSCKHTSTAQGIIGREQMVGLLTNVHIADGGMYNTVSVNPDTLYKYGNARYLALFKRHHVDSSTFRRSLKYYTSQPVELLSMYDEIMKHIADKTDSANKSLLKSNNGQRPKTY